jgi:hypothetical protein
LSGASQGPVIRKIAKADRESFRDGNPISNRYAHLVPLNLQPCSQSQRFIATLRMKADNLHETIAPRNESVEGE